MKAALFALALAFAAACASRPRPTDETVRRSTNPPAVVEGRVRDPQGRPVAGIAVRGLPRDKHLLWSPASVTDAEGRFRLTLVAPGEYGFLLEAGGITVVTSRADDPARVVVRLEPGARREDVDLVFRGEEWERVLDAPAPKPSPHGSPPGGCL